MSTAEMASKHFKTTHVSVNERCRNQASAMISLVRPVIYQRPFFVKIDKYAVGLNLSESHAQHASEIDCARNMAEQDTDKLSEDIVHDLDRLSERQQVEVSGLFSSLKTQSQNLEVFKEDHSGQVALIRNEAETTFKQRYTDYEPTGATPVRTETDIPSKGVIEALCTLPMDVLLEEYRENHPYDSVDDNDLKPSLIPRSPLVERN